ncbi:excinuclease ABC subunit UvrA [Cryomorphaceae bacterium]|nr:excinuclease ABC subunit UvrA [Cryomorphaceae bacterium]
MTADIESYNPKENILIKGARLHNLKNIDVVIPRNRLVVVTGLSGSGKSSLAFDTLYAEGQRRYVESLSSYARQFLGRLNKPEVEYIKGIAPAIAIEQKVNTRNPRSTVGTSTEIYDYLKLLYARIGRTFSPISGQEVQRHSVTDVVNAVAQMKDGTRIMVLAPVQLHAERNTEQQLKVLQQQGFARLRRDSGVDRIDDLLEQKVDIDWNSTYLVVDRLAARADDEDTQTRLADSVQTAFYEGKGICIIEEADEQKRTEYSNRFELDGMEFDEPSEHLFSFNNPYGACPKCEGYGSIIGIDEDLVVPNKGLSIYEDAIVCWKGEKMQEYKNDLILNAERFDFPIHRPYYELTDAQRELLWEGNGHFMGINAFFEYLESKSYKIQYRVMLSRYRGKTRCTSCKGRRLRKEAGYVQVDGHKITDLVELPIGELQPLMENLQLNEYEQGVSKRILIEITSRLRFLNQVGLDYLTLNRRSSTLSGGESQRINLATSLGSSLVGSMYILDEPSIGLHSKDTERLIEVLQSLRDLGNTVIVVEHDEDIMKAADLLIDIGPMAGTLGGELIFWGTHEELLTDQISLTGQYLTGKLEIPVPDVRRKGRNWVELHGARENNLRNINTKFPLEALTVVSGVSGSGKSTLIKDILYPALKKRLGGYAGRTGEFDGLGGSVDQLKEIEFVDQNPIGKSSRSNPVTYVKAYDEIRALYASQKLSKNRGYKAKHFSFNVEGGRCDNCEGEGEVQIEMQFMADVHLTCEVCKGQRFKDEILEVKVDGKNIYQVLEMTIDEAIDFFTANKHQKIADKLQPLQDVGLGYIHLGQSSSTLSGGEAQRVKLASFLSRGGNQGHTLFIFDEPTTGLHFHDILKLLDSFNALIAKGHSILIIEHNLDIIKCADWVIDLGPEGGVRGGNILFEGTPEGLVESGVGFTSGYLAEKL